VLFSYKTTYKITKEYTPYQLVYGLHPLMPTKYIVPFANGNERDSILVKFFNEQNQIVQEVAGS
jgi:hypothetical protein